MQQVQNLPMRDRLPPARVVHERLRTLALALLKFEFRDGARPSLQFPHARVSINAQLSRERLEVLIAKHHAPSEQQGIGKKRIPTRLDGDGEAIVAFAQDVDY